MRILIVQTYNCKHMIHELNKGYPVLNLYFHITDSNLHMHYLSRTCAYHMHDPHRGAVATTTVNQMHNEHRKLLSHTLLISNQCL